MKVFTGRVVADKMKNAVTVLVERRFSHPLYGKVIRKSSKIHARDDIGVKVGQVVKIQEVKPIAKTIFFKVVTIVDKKVEFKPREIDDKLATVEAIITDNKAGMVKQPHSPKKKGKLK